MPNRATILKPDTEALPADAMPAEALLTVFEASWHKGVSVPAVYRAMREGRLPFVTVAGQKAVQQSDIDSWHPQLGGARPGSGRKPKHETMT